VIERLRAQCGFGRTPFGRDLAPSMLHQHRGPRRGGRPHHLVVAERAIGVVTGEVGAGKTVAARTAVAGLDPVRRTIVYLPNPCIGQRACTPRSSARSAATRFHKAALVAQAAELLAAEDATVRRVGAGADGGRPAPDLTGQTRHPT